MEILHYSVLKNEVLEMLSPQDGDLMVDGTTGEGGHTEALLLLQPGLNMVALDADEAIQAKARERLAVFGDRVQFYLTWFNDFFSQCPLDKRPDGILLDLGISMFHYEASGRGFSFRRDEPLDMRLNPDAGPSAADLVNGLPEEELAKILYEFAEERLSRRIASAVVRRRKERPFETASDLADLIRGAYPAAHRHGRIHPATKSFQALRIAVNRELDRLAEALEASFRLLKVGGRMAIITFHSLEDRVVKTFIREKSKACICGPQIMRCQCGATPLVKSLVGKPLVASDKESHENPASRSAKLRGYTKLAEERG